MSGHPVESVHVDSGDVHVIAEQPGPGPVEPWTCVFT